MYLCIIYRKKKFQHLHICVWEREREWVLERGERKNLSASATQTGERREQSEPSKQVLHSQTCFPSTISPSKYALPCPEQSTEATASASAAATRLQLSSNPSSFHLPIPPIYRFTNRNTLRVTEAATNKPWLEIRSLTICTTNK